MAEKTVGAEKPVVIPAQTIAGAKILSEQEATLTPPFPATATGGPIPDHLPQPAVVSLEDDDDADGRPEGHSKKAKTYRALEVGTDWKQGIIMQGEVFTTTQPKGTWMEEVKLA